MGNGLNAKINIFGDFLRKKKVDELYVIFAQNESCPTQRSTEQKRNKQEMGQISPRKAETKAIIEKGKLITRAEAGTKMEQTC